MHIKDSFTFRIDSAAPHEFVRVHINSHSWKLQIVSFMKTRCLIPVATMLLTAPLAQQSQASSTIVTVDSHAAPWEWVGGGLNDAYKYGVQDSTDAGDGF